ncbi:HAD-superfamily hydrolase, subfamily IA, variant 3 [Corchorus capsularis]|uniref:HAD-superfamily hydrolase, subfamily IA, variant 3 n=1 Tax=Corchorus capsularis TaxID=210143 RepID=A0A1R3H7N7_COCAP|nr:HAD-superfamily hydrolase, subfamily IA, variant 3 [Corchorus capsularis]
MEFENRYRLAQSAKYDCLLFDLDDTLYPISSGLARECGKNIKDYMVEKLGIDKDKIVELSNLLYKNYGTTMAGLRVFLLFTFSLFSISQNIIFIDEWYKFNIFTNADRVHAVKALSKLGLEDCFEGIICFETLNPTHKNTVSDDEDDIEFLGSSAATTKTDVPSSSPEIFDIVEHFANPKPGATLPKTPIVCKPQESAIELALKIAKINPQRTLFFEDSVRNIQAGKRVGLHTVLVGTSQRPKGADYALESIHNIKQALPELWETDMKKSEVKYPNQVPVETSVTA